ncbi:MAG: hypothetical protein QM680_00705 [Luteolibacter sp.]
MLTEQKDMSNKRRSGCSTNPNGCGQPIGDTLKQIRSMMNREIFLPPRRRILNWLPGISGKHVASALTRAEIERSPT